MSEIIHQDPLANMRLVSVKKACELTLYSRVHLYRMERDGKFIRRVQIGQGRVGYYLHELETWLRNRPRGPIAQAGPNNQPSHPPSNRRERPQQPTL